MRKGPKLVIVGKQGAGKGTQCVRLARHFVIPHISTGDMFRSAQRADSELGAKLRLILEAGELVPDELTVSIVAERMAQDDTAARGFILDGFPRTPAQAKSLDDLLAPNSLDLVIDLQLSTELATERLCSRRVCRDCQSIYGPSRMPAVPGTCDDCGGSVIQRADDTEEAIRRRLSLYESQTAPVLEWYRSQGLLVEVDGDGSTDDVTTRLVHAIDAAISPVSAEPSGK